MDFLRNFPSAGLFILIILTALLNSHLLVLSSLNLKFSLHPRLPQNYDDPLTFLPVRFLEPQDKWNRKFLPFSTGPYMCVGHIFSLTEVKVTLALLLRHFCLAISPGYKFKRVRYLTIQPKPPLSLLIRPLVDQ